MKTSGSYSLCRKDHAGSIQLFVWESDFVTKITIMNDRTHKFRNVVCDTKLGQEYSLWYKTGTGVACETGLGQRWLVKLDWDRGGLWNRTGTGVACETGLRQGWLVKLDWDESGLQILVMWNCTLYRAHKFAPKSLCNFGHCNVQMHTNVERSLLEEVSIRLSMYTKK